MNEDLRWINQALQGDDNAFGILVEKYQKPVFSLCYRMLGNAKDAEDAAQESFIRAYRHLKKYDQTRSFATWLLSIASHYCIDRVRKHHLETISVESIPAEVITDHKSPNPEKVLHASETEVLIQYLLDDLKPTDRAAVVLRYWYEYSEVEIAETLDLSVSAVKSRLYRSRRALADAWLSAEKTTMTKRRHHESPAF